MRFVTRRTVAVLALLAALASLAGCGADHESVRDLVTTLRSAGIACPLLTEQAPQSRNSVGHGSCWTADNRLLFEVDVYGSENDLKKDISSRSEGSPLYCFAFGDLWTVSIAANANNVDCAGIADRLNGQVLRSD
jgi:hypothetical protein